MNALDATRHHCAHAQQGLGLGRPVTAGAGAVVDTGEHHHWRTGIALRRVVQRQALAVVGVPGPGTRAWLLLAEQAVTHRLVGECATQHHFVVAAAGGVLVEVLRVLAARQQPLASLAVGRDRAGRGNMVGGHVVAQHHQWPRTLDRQTGLGFGLDIGQILRTAKVGGPRIPRELHAAFGRQRLPMVGTVPDGGQALPEEFRLDHPGRQCGDLLVAGHKVVQVHRVAGAVMPERFAGQVDLDGTGDGEGHAKGRRSQVTCGHLGVHPAFEVAVARQHHHAFQALVGKGFHVGFKLAGVADAGHAAKAGQVKAQGREVLQQVGLGQVVSHHLGARRQRSLDPGLALQPQAPGVTRQQSSLDHLRRVGSVGATGDRRDHHGAVTDRRTEGWLEKLLCLGAGNQVAVTEHLLLERGARARQRLPLVRLVRAGDTRLDGGQVQFDQFVELRLWLVIAPMQVLGMHVAGGLQAQLG
ncbi:hypothetical protein D3C79_459170 [compost metagenome]